MARRPYYYASQGYVKKQDCEFEWFPGMAPIQKKRNVESLHKAMNIPALEISTKSDKDFGRRLSAFNLTYRGRSIEKLYQASKVFERGGPYKDLLDEGISPREAKRDERLKNSGKIMGFHDWNSGEDWEDEPYYDYLYCLAVKENFSLEELKQLNDYEGFTDIEFNPQKGMNTQAKAIVIVKILLEKFGEIPDLNKSDFIKFHKQFVRTDT